MDEKEILRKSTIFSQRTDEEIERMSRCLDACARSYGKEEYIFTVGDVIDEMGIVLSGQVRAVHDDYWGKRTIVENIPPGGTFGEAFAFTSPGRLIVSYVAAEKTRVFFIKCRHIVSPCAKVCYCHTSMIGSMLSEIAGKNVGLTQKLEHISCRTTREKLLSYLSAQATVCGRDDFSIPFNRQELADYLSVDRSAMSSVLSSLRSEGVLDFHKKSFKLNRDAFAAEGL